MAREITREVGDRFLLLRVLKSPREAADLSIPGWELLLRQARFARLLPRLTLELREDDALWSRIPDPVRPHLEGALGEGARAAVTIAWELDRLTKTLAHLEVPLVALKGAAYGALGLPSSPGRLSADVDFMVPQDDLDRVRETMLATGWITATEEDYEAFYNRRWMHELPLFRHSVRGTLVDVHHNILPPSNRACPDAGLLLRDKRPVPGGPDGLFTLSPGDMILHSAAHLFFGEFHSGFRDLMDLDRLFQLFASREEGFWESIESRSVALGLEGPLHYAAVFCREWWGTPVPATVGRAGRAKLPFGATSLMRRLLLGAVFPPDPGRTTWEDRIARWSLFARHHALRMPFWRWVGNQWEKRRSF